MRSDPTTVATIEYCEAASRSVDDVLARLSARVGGLRESEAKERLSSAGPNVLRLHATPWWQYIVRQIASPFIAILFGAALLALLLREVTDALFIIFFVVVNTALGFAQEFRADRSIRALQRYVARMTHVRRENTVMLVRAETLVPGDCVVLEAGDTIPADVRFISANHALIDESALTGESAPVEKRAENPPSTVENPYQAHTIGFSGTTLVGGKAEGLVIATGRKTVVGQLASLAVETEKRTAFEEGMAKLSAFILKLVVITLVLVLVFHLVIVPDQYGPVELIIFAIALAVGVIPEALPLVITVSLAQGALRLAHRHVVPKRLSAIEDLGSIDVLCTDKTGTITENQLRVSEWYGDRASILRDAALASAFFGERVKQPNNAFDLAVWKELSGHEQASLRGIERYLEVPFDPERRRNAVVVHEEEGATLIVRGAPENILARCDSPASDVLPWVRARGARGLRTLAVARKLLKSVPHDLTDNDERGLTFVGLLAFHDPLKSTAKATIEKAHRLGVVVKIVTGDSAEVATSVGRSIGLIGERDQAITGSDFSHLSHAEKHERAERCHIFARMTPELKLELMNLLQKHHTVGFLGEGFNDAPALKVSHVALSVQGASDIAQEASDIILLNKSLDVIIDGIREGRRTFANTMKYIKSTLASNLGNFFALAMSTLFIPFLPMLPVQILLVNLLTDFPLISIATDTVDENDIAKPEPYRVRDITLVAIVLGLVSAAFDFLFFGYFLRFGEAPLQTYWFIGSVFTELVLLFSIRSRRAFFRARRPSLVLTSLTVLAAVVTVAILLTSLGTSVFHFAPPAAGLLVLAFGIVVAYFVCTELVKLWYYRTFGTVSSAVKTNGKPHQAVS